MKLDSIEEQLKPEELFLKWLVEEKVDFITLTEQYTKYLENENKKRLIKNSRYENLLAQFLEYGNLSPKNEWVKDKTIGTLYAYKSFEGAPIYESWKEIISRNNINTDLKTLDYEVYNEEISNE